MGRPGPGSRLNKLFLGCALCAVGALITFLVLPEPAVRAASPVRVAIDGHPVEPQKDNRRLSLAIARHYLGESLTLVAAERQVTLRRADLGVAVDIKHLQALLDATLDSTSPLRRVHAQTHAGQLLRLPIPARLDTDVTMQVLLRLKDQLDRPPINARVDPRKQEIVPAETGRRLDVYATLERIDRALTTGERRVKAALRTLKPGRDVSAFKHIDMSSVLGSFETRHSRHDNARNRSHNLRVAAAKIDGYVLGPGQVFDFNEVVGDRTESNGFKQAPVIAYGKLVDGMGGGTCQIASTLHAAVFFSGLAIVTRHPHSRPSSYIKLGLDAAVAYGTLNFRFKNDREYPVVIGLTVKDGRVRAALHGPRHGHTITFMRRVDEAMPFEEKEINDESLPRGFRVLQQRGIPGFKLTRWRVVRDDATRISRRERMSDTYPPTTQLWRVGAGGDPGDDFQVPKNDAHPEYVADEYLSATQSSDGEGLKVIRKPGRYGYYGWTEREGMMAVAKNPG